MPNIEEPAAKSGLVSSNGKSVDKSTYRYSSDNLADWNLYQLILTELFADKKITYLLSETEVARRKMPVPPPQFLIYTPGPAGIAETPAEKEKRQHEQKMIDSVYLETVKEHNRKLDRMDEDLETAINVVLGSVDQTINRALHKITAKVKGEPAYERFKAIRSELESAYGPNSNRDVQKLHDKLATLSVDSLSPKIYLQDFMQLVDTLERIVKRGLNGDPIRGPLPPLPDDEPPNPRQGASKAVCKTYCQLMYDAWKDRSDKHPNGGPILTYKPEENQLRAMLMSAMSKSKIHKISQYHNALQLPENALKGYTEILRTFKAIGDDCAKDQIERTLALQSKDKANTEGTHRHVNNLSIGSNNQKGDYGSTAGRTQHAAVKCKNCGGAHYATVCPSKTCFTCYPQRKFDSADERKRHYLDVHAQDRAENKSTGSRNGKNGGGRGASRGGRSGRGGRGGHGGRAPRANSHKDAEPSAPPDPGASEDSKINTKGQKRVNRVKLITAYSDEEEDEPASKRCRTVIRHIRMLKRSNTEDEGTQDYEFDNHGCHIRIMGGTGTDEDMEMYGYEPASSPEPDMTWMAEIDPEGEDFDSTTDWSGRSDDDEPDTKHLGLKIRNPQLREFDSDDQIKSLVSEEKWDCLDPHRPYKQLADFKTSQLPHLYSSYGPFTRKNYTDTAEGYNRTEQNYLDGRTRRYKNLYDRIVDNAEYYWDPTSGSMTRVPKQHREHGISDEKWAQALDDEYARYRWRGGQYSQKPTDTGYEPIYSELPLDQTKRSIWRGKEYLSDYPNRSPSRRNFQDKNYRDWFRKTIGIPWSYAHARAKWDSFRIQNNMTSYTEADQLQDKIKYWNNKAINEVPTKLATIQNLTKEFEADMEAIHRRHRNEINDCAREYHDAIAKAATASARIYDETNVPSGRPPLPLDRQTLTVRMPKSP